MNSPLRLTQTVQKGGCAAKVPALELRRILSGVEFPPPHPELLIDGRHFDDAAIYQISDEVALVQTIDFFTPILDTPRTFGQVAAANALSDVYAMGGSPKTALGVLAVPLASLSEDVIREVMQGASDKVREAGANLVGGHSIDDDTLKFGLSVTGFVHPKRIWSNQGSKPGDSLILTKPLGTGTMTAALKRSAASETDIAEAIESMTRLNNVLDFLSPELAHGVHGATDITGFGLSGHATQMARASNVTIHFEFESIPYFTQVPDFLEKEFLTKAHRTNRDYSMGELDSSSLSGWRSQLIHDPQTSGGLLLSCDAEIAPAITQALAPYFPGVTIVGRVSEPTNHRVLIHS